MIDVLPTVVVTADNAPTPARIDIRERLTSGEENLRTFGDALRSTIWTSLVCVVEVFHPETATLDAQPAIQGVVLDEQNNRSAVDMPMLVDVPVLFQYGGGSYHTHPIKPGDECLVYFSARDIDNWWEKGGVQPPMSKRILSLSDGFAMVGPQSKKRVPAGISTTESQWRNADNSAGIYLNPTTGHVTIKAPGGLTILADINHTGKQHSSDTISSDVDVLSNRTSGHTHVHTEVRRGSEISGAPL